MQQRIKILVLENQQEDIVLIKQVLTTARLDIEIKVAENRSAFINALEKLNADVILSNHHLPQLNSIEALRICKEHKLNIPFISFSASANEEIVAAIIKMGAHDFILKENLSRLPKVIETALVQKQEENEKQQALLALIKSEERCRLFVTEAADAIFYMDEKGFFKEVNKSAATLLGYSQNELMQMNLKDIVPTDEVEKIPQITQSMKHNKTVLFERHYLNKSGTRIAVEVNAKKLPDGSFLLLARNISKRKKAEEALVKSELHYHALTELSPNGVFHTDETGYTTYVNPRWCAISGLNAQEALGNGWLKAVHEDDRYKLIGKWETANKAGETSQSEYRFVKPDGTIAWVIGYAVPEINSANEVIGYIGTITDITDRKLIEDELKKSEEKYRTNLSRITDGFISLDKNWCYTYINKKAAEIFGRLPEEMLGKEIGSLFSGKSKDIFMNQYFKDYKKAFEKQEYICQDEYYPLLDRWYENHVYPSPEGISIYFREITERKKTATLISDSQRQLEFVSNHIPFYIAHLDLEKKYKFVNKPYADLFGFTANDFVGKAVYEILGEVYYASVSSQMDIALTGKTVKYPIELPPSFRETISGADKLKNIEVSYIPEFNDNAEVAGFIVAIADITEIKTAEEKINQLNLQLEERVKERTAELETANADLEEMNELFIGNEANIIELKQELKELKQKLQ